MAEYRTATELMTEHQFMTDAQRMKRVASVLKARFPNLTVEETIELCVNIIAAYTAPSA